MRYLSRSFLVAGMLFALANVAAAQQQTMPGMDHSRMQGMDHSGMSGKGMQGMDHSTMPGMRSGAAAQSGNESQVPARPDTRPGRAPRSRSN